MFLEPNFGQPTRQGLWAARTQGKVRFILPEMLRNQQSGESETGRPSSIRVYRRRRSGPNLN